jgi:hypothetical protein
MNHAVSHATVETTSPVTHAPVDVQRPGSTRRGAGRFWLLVAVAAVGLVVPAASEARSAPKPKPVPFEASVKGTLSSGGDDLHFLLDGTAIASHLGRSKYSGDVEIQTQDAQSGVITDILVETLTAANGDTLTILCEQTAVPVSPGVYQATDKWTVIGGTGRFSDATGSGTGDTQIDLGKHVFTKHLSGSISTASCR